MTHFKCYSIAILMALLSLQTKDIITSTGTYPKYSTMTILESSLINDTIHHIGEMFGGGVIFFVDNTGHHGLICSISDINDPNSSSPNRRQYPQESQGSSKSEGHVYHDFAIDNPDRAEELCDNYTNSNYGTGVFSDWHLPTRDQLETMYKVKDEVNLSLEKYNKTFTDPLVKIYWSSSKTQNDIIGSKWLVDFDGGSLMTTSKPRPGSTFTRAIRAF
jgi:hypothetical protein